jgi:DamX protein
MSAQASTQIGYTINNKSVNNSNQKTATPISVTARIDYIQRFSKQMTLVVDESSTVYSQLARQYLANISQASNKQEANVAFVAASSKVNDIQMRCRLIEQLFANTLFDPEQSLAVSILRLAKQSEETITIVVEHAQSLPLQIKYELCQLVDIAKKTQNTINVVLFGSEEAAKNIEKNRSIFDKKLSIVDGKTGQVLPIDHARFKSTAVLFNYKTSLNMILITLIGSVLILLVWFALSEHENFSLTTLPTNPSINTPSKAIISESTVEPVQPVQIVNTESSVKTKLASSADIHLALLGQEENKTTLVRENKAAVMSDILQALAVSEGGASEERLEANHSIDLPLETETLVEENVEDKLTNRDSLPIALNNQYYLNSTPGYVVQIAGFSDLAVLTEFIKQNENLNYYSYQRKLKDQLFVVLTSQVYSNRKEALEVLNSLPSSIKSLGSFIKSVSTIKREINIVDQ